MYQRTLSLKKIKHSFFLFGPRQVGKSTLLKQLDPILNLNLLDPKIHLQYNRNPNLLMQQLERLPPRGIVLIDEIQKTPKLLDVVHLLMEQNPAWIFAMSGSSARKLRHGAANLLGGRAIYQTLHPLSSEELGKDFDLPSVLRYGSLPKIYSCLVEGSRELAEQLLESYVITYLQEEVKAEALVRNLEGFQNFLEIAAAQFGEQVNFSDLSRSCAVAYSSVREYYSILEDTLMGFLLRPYLKSPRKRMSHSPKFYFFDNGVTRAIQGLQSSEASQQESGRLFEQWMLQEVLRINAYYRKSWRFSFWRTQHGAEVDLLIEQGSKILAAVEIKFKSRLAASDFSGLQAFQEAHPKVPTYLVAPVAQGEKILGMKVDSPTSFFERLVSGKFS